MGPTVDEISVAAQVLSVVCPVTPVARLDPGRFGGALPEGAEVWVKLELFQQAGSFKARGAYLGIKNLTPAQRDAGVVAASGGNHALAVSWAANAAGVQATIAMPQATDPLRVEGCRALGATVILCPDMPAAFARMEAGAAEGQTLMHPFEASHMILGAATCGAEFVSQVKGLDAVVIPVGGGGLIAGMATASKALHPAEHQVIGVEPFGANSMTQSLQAGRPVTLDRIDTIADSLSAPKAMPLTFAVAQAKVDQMVQVTDDQLRAGMRAYFDALRLVAEPACAAALAAICGPLRAQMAGKRIGIIACGSNISLPRYQALLG